MRRAVLSFSISYLVLAFYFYVIPTLFYMNDILRFFHLLLFFPLAFLMAKLYNGRGLESYGLRFFKGWYKNLCTGFLIGFTAWTVLFFFYFIFKKYNSIELIAEPESLLKIVVIIIGFGLGSIINDILVRGLIYSHFRMLSFNKLIVIAVLFYALDDCWNEGLSFQNIVFSILLGLSLSYSFYRTHSIWANSGLHIGLNVVYGLFFGVSGNKGEGIFTFNIAANPPTYTYWLSSILAFLVFLLIYYKGKSIFINYEKTKEI